MKLIIGLGNPGKKYEKNRHNVGEMFVTYLKAEGVGREWKLETLKSFMNDSGSEVREIVRTLKLPLANLYIVHDDLDLGFGEYKIQFGKGPYGHKGILSIEEALGTKDFWRIRIGVDNRDPQNRTPGVAYTLEDFTPREAGKLPEVFKQIATSPALGLR